MSQRRVASQSGSLGSSRAGLGLLLAVVLVFALAVVLVFALEGHGNPAGSGLGNTDVQGRVAARVKLLKAEWDARLFVCDVGVAVSDHQIILTGRIDRTRHVQLLSAVRTLADGRWVRDQTIQLPESALLPECWGLVRLPVANLGDAPGQDDGQHTVTQARLGEAVEILLQSEGWYLVRKVDDGYLGWLAEGSLVRVDEAALAAFQAGEQVQVTALLADIRVAAPSGKPGLEPSLQTLTLVMGTILPLARDQATHGLAVSDQGGASDESLVISFPDGGRGLVRAADVRRLPSLAPVVAQSRTAQGIVALAERHLGRPYLWGGTTAKGFDCSGFVQFVFGFHGYRLPRDADLQFAVGRVIGRRDELQPGDLVFWSTYKAGPSHVGIFIGDARYIHCQSAGGVTINSFDPDAPDYSERLDVAYFGARRVLGSGP